MTTSSLSLGFRAWDLASNLSVDLPDERFPGRLSSWEGSADLAPDGTHFGFVQRGSTTLECAAGQFTLGAGFYFCVPGAGRLRGGTGVVSSRVGWTGLFGIGGPIEEEGRLRYIDGCTDTLLIGPVQLGDPCLNLLHIPPGTAQTAHTHPSWRSGVIASGRGLCRTSDRDWPLRPGLAFAIAPGTLHSFHTRDEALRVIAWHPDSDFGPTDEDHPMINRTWIP